MGRAIRCGVLILAIGVAGCGTPGPPLPPSLHLPMPVNDLAAVRTGDQVALTWTMPHRTTDKVDLKGPIPVQICRKDGDGSCVPVADVQFAPGVDGSFVERLRGPLASADPRPLRYFVELRNSRGRSAGLSNAAEVLAGRAPDAVNGLTAEVHKQGVVLRWMAAPGPDAIRLHRTLLNQPPAKKHAGPFDVPPEPLEQNLLVSPDAGRALDTNVEFGHAYEYRAQRIARVTIAGHTLELAGPVSGSIRVEALDVFPPSSPTGLAAVATPASEGVVASIDLNWQPVDDPDLAGYIVYRRDGDTAWTRISPAQPLVAPAFHDANVEAGHTYHYTVSAVDQGGHQSTRSLEAEETVPAP